MSRSAIEDLVHLYADAVVHRDGDQWSATWDADGVWKLGQDRRAEGRKAIYELWNTAIDGFNAVVQNVLNGTVELDDPAGTGTGRWYILEHWQRINGDRGILLAYYNDTYVCRDDRWLFASRELVPQYSGSPDLSAPFLNAWSQPDN